MNPPTEGGAPPGAGAFEAPKQATFDIKDGAFDANGPLVEPVQNFVAELPKSDSLAAIQKIATEIPIGAPEPAPAAAPGYIMGEAAGGPPPTNLGPETATPAAGTPAVPEAPATPVIEQASPVVPITEPLASQPTLPGEMATAVRPNTPAERALAMGTTNKSAEQIKADQDWLQAEDPARPGFKINGQQIEQSAPRTAAEEPLAVRADGGQMNDDERRKAGMKRRDELSMSVLNGTASDEEKTEFGKLLDDPLSYTENSVAAVDVAAASADIDNKLRDAGAIKPSLDESQPDAKPHADTMGTQEIADELESLPAEADATPIQNERRKQLEAAWDAKFNGTPPASPEQGTTPSTSEFPLGLDDAALNEMEKQGKMTPEQRAQYKAEAVRAAEKTAFDQQRPIDAKEGESFEDYKEREELIKKYNKGEDLSEDDMDKIADDIDTQDSIKDKLAKGQELNKYEQRLATKYGLPAEAKVSDEAKRDNRLNELELKIRANNASPEDRKEYMKLRAEKDQQKKDADERDQLRDKLLTEGKLTDEQQARLDELEGKLKDKELTTEEKRAESDRLALKIAEDLLSGKNINEDDLERFRALKAEQALEDAGVESGRSSIMSEIKKSLAERRSNTPKESAVEKQTQAKLAELMNLELQMLAVPRQLEALAKQQDDLRKDIDKKKNEIGSFNNQSEIQQKNRTELYPLLMGLARNKKYIAHYVNHSRVLKAQYKTTMADLNRTLHLNGRFGIIPDVFQHLDAMIARANADLRTNYDSIYASNSGDARRIARSAA